MILARSPDFLRPVEKKALQKPESFQVYADSDWTVVPNTFFSCKHIMSWIPHRYFLCLHSCKPDDLVFLVVPHMLPLIQNDMLVLISLSPTVNFSFTQTHPVADPMTTTRDFFCLCWFESGKTLEYLKFSTICAAGSPTAMWQQYLHHPHLQPAVTTGC